MCFIKIRVNSAESVLNLFDRDAEQRQIFLLNRTRELIPSDTKRVNASSYHLWCRSLCFVEKILNEFSHRFGDEVKISTWFDWNHDLQFSQPSPGSLWKLVSAGIRAD